MSDLPINGMIPVDPSIVDEPGALDYARHLAKSEVNKKLAEANRVIDGELTEAWVLQRLVEGKIEEDPWEPGSPVGDATMVVLRINANTVPA